jgi:hypothetical protein
MAILGRAAKNSLRGTGVYRSAEFMKNNNTGRRREGSRVSIQKEYRQGRGRGFRVSVQ